MSQTKICEVLNILCSGFRLQIKKKQESQKDFPGKYYFEIIKNGLPKKYYLYFQPFYLGHNKSENVFSTDQGATESFISHMNFNEAYGKSKCRKMSVPININDELWETSIGEILIQYARYQPD
jgi:hypothetical protein